MAHKSRIVERGAFYRGDVMLASRRLLEGFARRLLAGETRCRNYGFSRQVDARRIDFLHRDMLLVGSPKPYEFVRLSLRGFSDSSVCGDVNHVGICWHGGEQLHE